MSKQKPDFEKLRETQNSTLRDPAQVICGNYETSGIVPQLFDYTVQGNFLPLLEKLKITLFVTREYEHLVVALNVKNKKVRQSFLHLPHPNGIVADRKTNKVYVASTRSPNQIVELSPVSKLMPRAGYKAKPYSGKFLVPSRTKYYAGAYYFHDLAIIGGKLYANSVGKNGIIEINFNAAASEETVWSPLPVKQQNANHLQLNSIAAGKTLAGSYFSASAEKPGEYKPGDLNFPVDKKGVIFSGKTKKVVVRDLTRPHSAKLHANKLWVNNSGYGELGFVEKGVYQPFMDFPGWTRGLSFFGDVAFVGISKIIPKFRVYAPGLKTDVQQCAVYAVDIKQKKILGSIEWPLANQIYGIEWLDAKVSSGFPFTEAGATGKEAQEFFFRHVI